MPTASTSSSPATEDALVRIPLDQLRAHPSNANIMEPALLTKLARAIERESRYPPLVVRPHPDEDFAYQILDGHHRAFVLRQLSHPDALCYVWPCDDATALLLLATLNRLEGADSPVLRAQLLSDLQRLMPEQDLAQLLPENAAEIDGLLSLVDLDPVALLEDLERAAQPSAGDGLRAFAVALDAEDEAVVEQAIALASRTLTGKNRRGRALAAVCAKYLETDDA